MFFISVCFILFAITTVLLIEPNPYFVRQLSTLLYYNGYKMKITTKRLIVIIKCYFIF